MNNKTAPFNDVRVRQAINYAIDPEALNRVFGGRLHPTQQILPPGMPGYDEFKMYPGPNMDKAKQLLAEANPADKDITVRTDDEPDRKDGYFQLIWRILSNPIILMIGVVEFTSGVLRDGILNWYLLFSKETTLGVDHIVVNWGFWGCVTGIAGGFAAGWISDKLFQSRRAPSA